MINLFQYQIKAKGLKMDRKPDRARIIIPAESSLLPLVLSAADEFFRLFRMEEDFIRRLQFGLEDLLEELINYQGNLLTDIDIEVSFLRDSHGFEIKINEKGVPYDLETIDRYSPEKEHTEDNIEGIGIYYLKSLMDKVEFRNLGKGGREIIIYKFIMDESLHKAETEIKEKTRKTDIKPVDYYIRAIRDSEAIELAKCVFFTYGYTYIYDTIYYPERVIELNRTGRMISAVAVTEEEEELMGHAALTMGEHDNIAEIGVAFVYPRFRGMKCLERMTEELIRKACELSLEGIFVQAVTSHVYSQKSAHRFGMKDTALLLLRISPMAFKEIKEGETGKETLLVCYRQLKERVDKKKYIPERYAEIAGKIYDSLGFEKEFSNPGVVGDLNRKTNISVKADVYNTATMRVIEYGYDFLDSMKKHIKNICLNRIDSIYIYLDLTEPFTYSAGEHLAEMGFFFAGIMPGHEGRDQLIMQYLNNCMVDYDSISIDSETGRDILNLIKEEDPNREV